MQNYSFSNRLQIRYTKIPGDNKIINWVNIFEIGVDSGQVQLQLHVSGRRFRVKTFGQLLALNVEGHSTQSHIIKFELQNSRI